MYISLSDIIKNELFVHSKILAGDAGLKRKVKRVSVFDCHCEEERIEKGIYKEGDLFLTCLDQFAKDKTGIDAYFHALGKTKSAGLIVITDELIDVIDEGIIAYCNKEELPVVVVYDDLTYAEVIDVCNRYIASDNMNSLNALKLEKIMYGHISPNEKMDVLYSINPNLKPYIRSVFLEGEFTSVIEREDAFSYHSNSKHDIFVRGENQMIYILSADSEKELKYHTDVITARISDFVQNPVTGFSRIYLRRDIAKVLDEGKRALETAKTMDMSRQSYDPMSSLQLLLNLKDTEGAADFYHAYVERISEKVSGESLRELLLTVETFVATGGSYNNTAEKMNQHSNTIRYRMNKVKSALDMENDNIKFYETIAIASKLRVLTNQKL